MNTALTIEAGKARSHQGWGWEEVTDAIISSLNDRRESLVFLLWGDDAKKKVSLIDIWRHT
ncbi:MAG: hypothetical protein PHR66_12560 [Desulfuromonadaceae bacterium]|nr:hypothetical protein [Desulfuromonadaceae bacterium]